MIEKLKDYFESRYYNGFVENINVDDMYIAEKKTDKLDIYNFIDNLCQRIGSNEIFGIEDFKYIKQAIEQIIKEKNEEIEKLKQEKKDFNALERLYKESLDKYQIENYELKQKKPDKEIIEWLKDLEFTNRYNIEINDKIMAAKLRKHFGEN